MTSMRLKGKLNAPRCVVLVCRGLVCAVLFLCSSLALAQSSDSSEVERYSREGQQALAEGRYSEAEEAFQKLSKLEPGVAEIYGNLGAIYFQEKKYEQAAEALHRAVKLKPNLQKANTLLAISLSELGRYREALPELEKGFRHSTDTETKRMCGLQLLRSYTGLQLDNKAVETSVELNRLYPDDAEILYHTGRVYGNSAFHAMEKLAKVAPASVWRHQAAAEVYESQGGYETALVEYREVLRLDPNRPGIHYRIGRTLLARSHQMTAPDDVAAALKEFEQENQMDPSNANAAYEIGDIHRQAGRFEQAQGFFELALKSYPDFEEAQTGLASVLMSTKKPEAALEHLQKAVALNPDDEVAWYRLSQVQKALGNGAEQQKALSEFSRLRHQFNQQKGIEPVFSPREVTKQELEPSAQP
jgi:tetratricopeptide (TPR) repeat protein